MRRMAKTELYFSTDIETDGPIPGENSMLSFASAVFNPKGQLIRNGASISFEANLEFLPDAKADLKTMEWWTTQPEAWEAHRQNLQTPDIAMGSYVRWVNQVCEDFNAIPICVCYPAGFDFTFLYWYLIKFAGKSPFGFSALDVKSYGMAVLGTTFKDSTKKEYPKEWFNPEVPHNHKALDDAVGQGHLFVSMLQYRMQRDLF